MRQRTESQKRKYPQKTHANRQEIDKGKIKVRERQRGKTEKRNAQGKSKEQKNT